MTSQSQPSGDMSSHAATNAEPSGRDSLLLKWGTIKGWNIASEAAKAALQRYFDAPGEYQLSAMQQRDTPEQKEALCALIDAVDGKIQNDWSGEMMTKDEAKAYVRDYGKR